MLGRLAGRWRRAHVERALQRAGISPRIAPEFYARLGAHAVAFVMGRPARITVGPALRAAIDATQGAPKVVFASHTGNWEASLAGMASHLPLVAIVKRQSQAWAERLASRRRTEAGIGLLRPEGSMKAGAAALSRGKTLVALGDQAPGRQRGAVRDRFLGQDCWTDKSPAVLAARARCPLWVIAQHEDADCTHVELLGSLAPRASSIDTATRDATALLDRFVRAHPADWLWLHRRWKDLPP